MKEAVYDFAYLMRLASRYSRYNTVTGICEPIDNSDDPKVKAKNVSITFGENEDGIINAIYIADDGLSMTKNEHADFWSVREKPEKFEEYDPDSLGKFGVGGKAGPISFGGTIILMTRRQGGKVYKSMMSAYNFETKIEPELVSDEEEALFNEKTGNAPHGTLIIIKDILKPYRITKEEFMKKDDCFNKLSLIYGNSKVNHFMDGKPFDKYDIMGGIDTATGKRVMAKVLTQRYEIFVEDCPIPLRLITFHRYRNSNDTIKWDYGKWGLAVYRNKRLTTITPLQDTSLFGEQQSCHRNTEFGAILFAENVHDDYLNMPYSKFITSAEKFNTSLLEQLSAQLKRDLALSSEYFSKEGNAIATDSLVKKGIKIAADLNARIQNFKMSSKYKKTAAKDDEEGKKTKKNKTEQKPKNDKTGQNSKPKRKKKIKFLRPVVFDDFGSKHDLISVDYEGDNTWCVYVNIAHPLFKSMSLNDTKLKLAIYYELLLSMAIENSMYTDGEDTFRRLSNNREELHDLQEKFVHDMERTYIPEEMYDEDDDVTQEIEELSGCEGTRVKFEDINMEQEVSFAESPSV